MSAELQRCGCSPAQLVVLPCCLVQAKNKAMEVLCLWWRRVPLRVLFIGRLDSYKRLDWLLEALAYLAFTLAVVGCGDGPHRSRFGGAAVVLQPARADRSWCSSTGACLSWKNRHRLLLQMSWCCPPIAAMRLLASCSWRRWRPAALPWLSTNRDRGWARQGSVRLSWSQSPEGLVEVLQRLADQPQMRHLMSLKLGAVHHLVCSFRLAAAVIQVWRSVKDRYGPFLHAVKGLR